MSSKGHPLHLTWALLAALIASTAACEQHERCMVDFPCFDRTMACVGPTTYRKLQTFDCEHACGHSNCGGGTCEQVGPVLSCPQGQFCIQPILAHDASCHAPEKSGDPTRIGAWVKVSAGSYVMIDGLKVKLTRAFDMAATEVTQGQFKQLLGYNPSRFAWQGEQAPVDGVSWHEAAGYCNHLSKAAGLTRCYQWVSSNKTCFSKYDCEQWSGPKLTPKEACVNGRCLRYQTAPQYTSGSTRVIDCPGYRLPTEAEWEHACQAGTGGWPSPGASAWYHDNAKESTHAVARKKPNAWGLYDLLGNVAEWTHDFWADDLGAALAVDPVRETAVYPYNRTCRGGSWQSSDSQLMQRRGCDPEGSERRPGFRCVRTKPAAPAPDGGLPDSQHDAPGADSAADAGAD